MSSVYVGQIMMFGGPFAPRNFAFCNGQLLAITQNQALFSVLGTTYGGDGIRTFALPNLQSRLPLAQGTGPGLSTYQLGQFSGVNTVTLQMANLPAHTHSLNATTAIADTGTIGGTVIPGQPPDVNSPLFYASPVDTTKPPLPQNLAASACSPVGATLPHTNMMPSLCITFVIALQGVFPSRN
jgi:microcystin-dependent protein